MDVNKVTPERLSPDERKRALTFLNEFSRRPAERTTAEVDREIAEIRRARRTGGRRSSKPRSR